MRRRLPLLVVVIASLTGCVAGMAGQMPISSDGFDPIGPTSTVTGTVALRDNGCIFLESADASLWVVWPPGAVYQSTGEHESNIELADGTKVMPGDEVEIVGELMTRGGLPQGDRPEATIWGSHAGFCLSDTRREPEILRAESVTIA